MLEDSLPSMPTVKIGVVAAQVQFAGLIFPGEYQFSVAIPTNLPDGDQPIAATYNKQSTQSGALITIQLTIPPHPRQ